jgi:peroxin-13
MYGGGNMYGMGGYGSGMYGAAGMYGSSMYNRGMYGGGMGGMGYGGGMYGGGMGMGMGGMMGQDPNAPPPMPPPRWQTILSTLQSVMMVFGRISFLVDENTQVQQLTSAHHTHKYSRRIGSLVRSSYATSPPQHTYHLSHA